MEIKFAYFIVIGTLLVMALYCSSTNFVSAADECFGTASVGYVICHSTIKLSSGEEISYISECSKGKDGNWHCGDIGTTRVMPPGIEEALRTSAMKSLGKSH